MTKDEILSLAKQAGGTPYTNRLGETAMAFAPAELEAFANLIIAQERERVNELLNALQRIEAKVDALIAERDAWKALAEKIRSGT